MSKKKFSQMFQAKAKFNQGPWRLVKHKYNIEIIGGDGIHIGYIELAEKPFIDRKIANAALIAAAPAMFHYLLTSPNMELGEDIFDFKRRHQQWYESATKLLKEIVGEK